MEKEAICPYCRSELKAKPSRKKKCNCCSKFIYVRTLPINNERVLVTEGELVLIEKMWNDYRYEQGELAFKRKWISRLSYLGIDESKFELRLKQLEAGGVARNTHDIFWSLFNEALLSMMKLGDFQNLSSIYFEMALFLNEEGKNSFRFQQESIKAQLESLQLSRPFATKVQILTARDNGTCDACKPLEGRMLSFKEALHEMPIPPEKCSHKLHAQDSYSWCRCMYQKVLDR